MEHRDFRNFQRDFVLHLVEEHYIPDNIVTDFEIKVSKHGKLFADVAIIDPKSMTPIAIFDLVRDPDKLKVSYDYLHNYNELEAVDLFIVLQKKPADKFNVYRTFPRHSLEHGLTGRGVEKVDISKDTQPDEVPSYRSVLNKARSARVQSTRVSRDKTIDTFSRLSWLLAIFVGVVLVADITGLISVTSSQLAMLALFVALVIVPFMSKLKILGVEFERLIENQPQKEIGQQSNSPDKK